MKNAKPNSKVKLTPGPTETPKWLRILMATNSPHHHTKEYQKLLEGTREKLKELFGAPNSEVLLYAGSGTYMMEIVVANFVSPQDTVFLINTGHFAERWLDIAKIFRGSVSESKSEWGKTYSYDTVTKNIADRRPKIVLMQATDTSTGVRNNTNLKELMIEYSPSTLLAVDAVLEAAVSPIKMDREGIDILIGASQKAFMLPAGLGFIIFNQRAAKVLNRMPPRPMYLFDLKAELEAQRIHRVRFTPPAWLIAGLHAVLEKILAREDTWYQGFESRSRLAREKLTQFGFSLATKECPSNGLSVLRVPEGQSANNLVNKFGEKGFVIARGIDDTTDSIIRIAHFQGIGNDRIERFFQTTKTVLG